MNAQSITLYSIFVGNVIILMGGRAYICEILQYLKIDRQEVTPTPDLLVANNIIDQNLPAILTQTINGNVNLRQESDQNGTYLEDPVAVDQHFSMNYLGYRFLNILTRDGALMLDSHGITLELMELFSYGEIVLYFRYLEENQIISPYGIHYFLTDGFGLG